jgi:hypothetical protein
MSCSLVSLVCFYPKTLSFLYQHNLSQQEPTKTCIENCMVWAMVTCQDGCGIEGKHPTPWNMLSTINWGRHFILQVVKIKVTQKTNHTMYMWYVLYIDMVDVLHLDKTNFPLFFQYDDIYDKGLMTYLDHNCWICSVLIIIPNYIFWNIIYSSTIYSQ